MRTSIRYALPLAASLLISAPISAAEPSYSYAQGGYQTYLDDGEGLFFLGGSFQLTDDIYMTGEYSSVEFEGDAEIEVIAIRGGYIFRLDSGLHAYAEAGLARTELTIDTPLGSASADDTGLMLAGGIRTMLSQDFEARGGLEITTGDADEINFIGEGVYSFGGALSALGQLAYGTEAEDLRLRIGVRFDF